LPILLLCWRARSDVASRRAAPTWQRRRPCPASGGDRHAAREELGDEAEQVAISSAVLGLRKLRGERGHYAREAALPVEPVPDSLAGAASG
jgi:hypothetical protein